MLLGPGAKVLSIFRFLSLAVPVSGLKVRVREGALEHDWFSKVERKGTELEKEREEVVRWMTGSQKRQRQALGRGQDEGDLDGQSRVLPVGQCHRQEPLACTANVLQFFK